MPEIVYVLTNEAMEGMVKIGRTTTSVEQRIKELEAQVDDEEVRRLTGASHKELIAVVIHAANLEAQRDELLRLVFATVKSAPWQETLKRNDWAEYLIWVEKNLKDLEDMLLHKQYVTQLVESTSVQITGVIGLLSILNSKKQATAKGA